MLLLTGVSALIGSPESKVLSKVLPVHLIREILRDSCDPLSMFVLRCQIWLPSKPYPVLGGGCLTVPNHTPTPMWFYSSADDSRWKTCCLKLSLFGTLAMHLTKLNLFQNVICRPAYHAGCWSLCKNCCFCEKWTSNSRKHTLWIYAVAVNHHLIRLYCWPLDVIWLSRGFVLATFWQIPLCLVRLILDQRILRSGFLYLELLEGTQTSRRHLGQIGQPRLQVWGICGRF